METDGVRGAGAGLMRRIALLAVLVALLLPTATTATTTAPAPSAAPVLQQAVQGGDLFTGAPCDGQHGDGSDTVVRVVKKVRGVFLPHGLVPPTFGPSDTPARHEVLTAYLPAPRAAEPTHMYPRRGPPATGVHPSP